MCESQFDELLPEDSEQYQTVATAYLMLKSEDYETAYRLTKQCWYIAQRWVEIASNARKIADIKHVSKSDLYNWAYQRYRQMQLAHEHCRSVWRQGKEDSKYAE